MSFQIVEWDGKSYLNELMELSARLDEVAGVKPDFTAKVAVLYKQVKAYIYLMLDGNNNLVGYFTCKNYGNDTAFVTDFCTNPVYSPVSGKWARRVVDYIKSLGYKRIEAQVGLNNPKAIRLWDWLGFKKISYNIVLED